jgi:hypothetical protein
LLYHHYAYIQGLRCHVTEHGCRTYEYKQINPRREITWNHEIRTYKLLLYRCSHKFRFLNDHHKVDIHIKLHHHVTKGWTVESRSSSPGRVKNFLFSSSSSPALGTTQPPIQWVHGSSFPWVKRPGREADHSPPISAEVKNTWICISTTPYVFIA